jgi:hypothetical protein
LVGFWTIAAWDDHKTQITGPQTESRYPDFWDWMIEGLRKAGMPEA